MDILICDEPAARSGRAPEGRPAGTAPTWLGDDIGCDLVFDEGDAVPKLQLAFFQSLQSQQVRSGRLMQRVDRRIEIPVLLLQPCELGFEFALIFLGHDLC